MNQEQKQVLEGTKDYKEDGSAAKQEEKMLSEVTEAMQNPETALGLLKKMSKPEIEKFEDEDGCEYEESVYPYSRYFNDILSFASPEVLSSEEVVMAAGRLSSQAYQYAPNLMEDPNFVTVILNEKEPIDQSGYRISKYISPNLLKNKEFFSGAIKSSAGALANSAFRGLFSTVAPEIVQSEPDGILEAIKEGNDRAMKHVTLDFLKKHRQDLLVLLKEKEISFSSFFGNVPDDIFGDKEFMLGLVKNLSPYGVYVYSKIPESLWGDKDFVQSISEIDIQHVLQKIPNQAREQHMAILQEQVQRIEDKLRKDVAQQYLDDGHNVRVSDAGYNVFSVGAMDNTQGVFTTCVPSVYLDSETGNLMYAESNPKTLKEFIFATRLVSSDETVDLLAESVRPNISTGWHILRGRIEVIEDTSESYPDGRYEDITNLKRTTKVKLHPGAVVLIRSGRDGDRKIIYCPPVKKQESK